MEDRELTWRKASRSTDNGGNCVEVAYPSDAVCVRDSKMGNDSPILEVSPDEFRTFLASIGR